MFCPRCGTHLSVGDLVDSCPRCAASDAPGRRSPATDEGTTVAVEGEATRLSVRVLRRLSRDPIEETHLDVDASASRDAAAAEPLDIGWKPGHTIAGKYEILGRIGDGGFGTVFKVRHVQRRKLYALKVPHPEYVREESFRRRFEREIEALERFVHPDMVTVRDSGVSEDGMPYYTMDFFEGDTLKEILLREGKLDLARALHIARSILTVLEAAHANQIIHRDIKPENVLLTRRGEREVVKLLDFGVAKLLDLVGTAGNLTNGMRVGTPKYMSPEQIAGEAVDGRSDLFAVGILLYEMTTGRHPFADGCPVPEIAASIVSRRAEPPERFRPDLPPELGLEILRLLEKKPGRRPPSARAVLDSLPERLETRERSTALEPLVRLVESARRGRTDALVLTQRVPAGLERHFLAFKPQVTFGRSGELPGGRGNDWILRRLPCRSSRLDSANWERNLTISARVGSIRAERSAVVIEPCAGCAGGVVVGGVRSRRAVRIAADRFHVSIGDHALDLDGVRVLRDTEREPFDLAFLRDTERTAGESPRGIGYSDRDCLIDYIRLTRADNHTLHSYFLVSRRLTLGSGADAGIRLPALPGVRSKHATLLFDGGEVFLASAGGEVHIVAQPGSAQSAQGLGAGGAPALPGNRTVLPPGSVYPVLPGMLLYLGEASIAVGERTDELFKSP